jgi:hypothetical protein
MSIDSGFANCARAHPQRRYRLASGGGRPSARGPRSRCGLHRRGRVCIERRLGEGRRACRGIRGLRTLERKCVLVRFVLPVDAYARSPFPAAARCNPSAFLGSLSAFRSTTFRVLFASFSVASLSFSAALRAVSATYPAALRTSSSESSLSAALRALRHPSRNPSYT